MKYIVHAALFTALCAAPSLAPAQAFADENAHALAGTAWNLTHLNGAPIEPATGGASLTFSVSGAAGRGPCNAYGGPVQVAGVKIAFGLMAATRRSCFPQARMVAETAYFAVLAGARNLQATDDALILFNAEGVDAARFRKIGSGE